MTKLTDSCSVDVLTLRFWNTQNIKTDRQLFGYLQRKHRSNPHNDNNERQFSVDVLRLHRGKPHNDNTDRQLFGGCTKTTPPETINDKIERQFHRSFTKPTSPLNHLMTKLTDIFTVDAIRLPRWNSHNENTA